MGCVLRESWFCICWAARGGSTPAGKSWEGWGCLCLLGVSRCCFSLVPQSPESVVLQQDGKATIFPLEILHINKKKAEVPSYKNSKGYK